MEKRTIAAVIIDSGLSDSEDLRKNCIGGCSIMKDTNDSDKIRIDNNYTDTLGHGTAVADALLKSAADIQVFCIKIYQDVLESDSNILIYAMNYIFDNDIYCDILLISSGITYIGEYYSMQDIVKKLRAKGTIIISAYDNDGTISYPAAFEEVIGVGISQNVNVIPQVIYDNMVNVEMPNKYYRLKWVKPSSIIISGSSFATGRVASIVAEILSTSESRIDLKDILKEVADNLGTNLLFANNEEDSSWKNGSKFVDQIKRAVIFPWNKEIHSIARFHEMLPFDIEGFYDIKYNFNVGKKISTLLGLDKELGTVKNIDEINWEGNFNTVICGHCIELFKVTGKDYLSEIIHNCQKYSKQLYAFDMEAEQYAASLKTPWFNYFVPAIKMKDYNPLNGGRLHNRLTPVVGVFGTSSRQGKYTLQMELRKRFEVQGYTVAHIASEPSGYLFKCQGVYPFGYNASVQTKAGDAVSVINQMVWEASKFNTMDVIIAGGQSGAVPYSFGNINQFNFQEYEFLCAVNPDVFVLCINPHDTVEYITRTIYYITSFNQASVVALVIFPIIFESANQIGYGYKQRALEEDELFSYKELFNKEINLPVYTLKNKQDIDELYHCIINELSEK